MVGLGISEPSTVLPEGKNTWHRPQKVGFIEGLYKPIHGTCAMYFYLGVTSFKRTVTGLGAVPTKTVLKRGEKMIKGTILLMEISAKKRPVPAEGIVTPNGGG